MLVNSRRVWSSTYLTLENWSHKSITTDHQHSMAAFFYLFADCPLRAKHSNKVSDQKSNIYIYEEDDEHSASLPGFFLIGVREGN